MAEPREQIESFLDLCRAEKAMRTQIKNMNDEQIVTLANSKGYSFTLQDLQNVLDPESVDKELKTKDLELVAGGLRDVNAEVTDGLVCNTIRSIFSGESGCFGGGLVGYAGAGGGLSEGYKNNKKRDKTGQEHPKT